MQIHSSNLNQNLNLASAHHHLHHLESARRSASSSSAEHGQFSMSNFTVAPSNHLLQASQKSALVKNSNTAGASNQESSHVYSAVYSGVSVFEMMCRNVAVMRRQKDSYLNATQVLKVANIEKGKRTKILEKEILNKEHEKVQGGYGKYQGTWYVMLCAMICCFASHTFIISNHTSYVIGFHLNAVLSLLNSIALLIS